MNLFFDTPEKILVLQTVAASWIGTPFMPNAAVKGAGVSCQKLAGAIYAECGFITPEFAIPDGPMDWGHAHKDSLIEPFMATVPNMIVVEKWQPGDMVGFKFGGCLHHSGICIAADGRFVHCFRNAWVIFGNLRDATYQSRLAKIWRPTRS